MTAPRSAAVFNPVKVGDLDLLCRTVAKGLAGVGWPEPSWHETSKDDAGRGQTLRAVAQGAELIFACGGDGTVMAVVTALAGNDVALAVLSAGTGNLLAANPGLGSDAATGVQVAIEGGRKRIDVGEQRFAVMASMGFDAQMLEGTSDVAKKHIRWLA